MLENVSETMSILIVLQLFQNPNVSDRHRIVSRNLIHVGCVVFIQHREWNAFDAHADTETEEGFQFTLK